MEQVIQIIAPSDVWDWFIYGIFFLSLFTLAVIPEKNMQPTLFMTIMLFLALTDKIRKAAGASIPIPGLENNGFATLMIHIAMFALPVMTAGLVRIRGRKGALSRPLAILTALIAGMYAVGFFFTFNR